MGLKLLSILLLSLISCDKTSTNNPIPEITFKDFIRYGNPNNPDSAKIIFTFVDENGDLGNTDSTSNCWISYYEIVNNSPVEYPEFERKYTLPNLTPNAQNKKITGEIEIIIQPAPIFNIFSTHPYQWQIKIQDRGGNFSNTIQSPVYEK